jgi:hypothetical protein
MHIAWRWVHGVASIGVEVAHLSLEQADVIGSRSSVELVESRTTPQNVVISLATIQLVISRGAEQPVVAFVAEQPVQSTRSHQGVVSRSATYHIIVGVSVDDVVPMAGHDHIRLVGAQDQICAYGSNTGCGTTAADGDLLQPAR